MVPASAQPVQPERRPALHVAEPKASPRPPAHLKAATRKWWGEVTGSYELEPHHLKLLEAACRAWDLMSQGEAALRRDGVFITDRYGTPKSHPAVSVVRDARVSFARLVRELDLEGEVAADPRQPRRRG
jgi:P27 family predicted phage terminase small subunit